MIWSCPRCHGAIPGDDKLWKCVDCRAEYGGVAGIPDLRVPTDAWINFEDDLVIARELAARSYPTLAELVRAVYARRPGWDERRVEMRTRQVLAAPSRLARDLGEWFTPRVSPTGCFLDLGCGPGMLISAASLAGRRGVGVDVSMTWLVVARRMISEHGGEPILAAAVGEALPLRDDAVDAIVSLDVIEHVRDAPRFLGEIDRTTAKAGAVILTTPNRFSLTAEPHVDVWGVGWLPRPWQAGFVRWRSGKSYDDTCLMSSFGLKRLLRRNTSIAFRLVVPPVPREEIARFGRTKARLARLYNKLCDLKFLRPVFLLISPFFRAEGVKLGRTGWIAGIFFPEYGFLLPQ